MTNIFLYFSASGFQAQTHRRNNSKVDGGLSETDGKTSFEKAPTRCFALTQSTMPESYACQGGLDKSFYQEFGFEYAPDNTS